MQLIAESGSTKTTWVVLQDGREVERRASVGLNPFYVTSETLHSSITEIFSAEECLKVEKVHFYGAGCSTKENVDWLSNEMKQVFTKAQVQINHDLLAAARGSFGSSAGMVAILGTGSNSCLYDGERIVDNVPALGFTLGDEGGGAWIGRQILKARYYREMPADVEAAFDKTFDTNLAEVLHHAYKDELPNRYVASFAPFAYDHIATPFMRELVAKSFNAFINAYLVKYKTDQEEVSVVGSIGFYFKDILEEELGKHGFVLGTVAQSPIEGLIRYHNS